MSTHQVTSNNGDDFEVLLNEEGRILDVIGPWPDAKGESFDLEGALPGHVNATGVPEAIAAAAESAGLEVCFYDPNGCRTCYCDGKGNLLRCVRMC